MGGLSAKELLDGPTNPREGDFVENCLESLGQELDRAQRRGSPHYRYDENTGVLSREYESDDSEYQDEQEGTDHYPKIARNTHLTTSERKDHTTMVGTRLHGPTFVDGYDEDLKEVSPTLYAPTISIPLNTTHQPVTESWPYKKVPQIIWMNERVHKDFAYAGLTVS